MRHIYNNSKSSTSRGVLWKQNFLENQKTNFLSFFFDIFVFFKNEAGNKKTPFILTLFVNNSAFQRKFISISFACVFVCTLSVFLALPPGIRTSLVANLLINDFLPFQVKNFFLFAIPLFSNKDFLQEPLLS